MAYGDYDDLPIRTDLDKVIRDQAFPIAKKIVELMLDQRRLALIIFNKKTARGAIKRKRIVNQKLQSRSVKSWLQGNNIQID